ncbi:DUF4124 domain-containing protein [Oceanobacter kriegii]|uniref:DUF4124 domain-containing protein n=1 Tax=Oceanobacter kriegii TaxID=64972 RepID=UPI0004854995|nr:DUF4124 domain-containing protein [Oceanobacter kriegii]
MDGALTFINDHGSADGAVFYDQQGYKQQGYEPQSARKYSHNRSQSKVHKTGGLLSCGRRFCYPVLLWLLAPVVFGEIYQWRDAEGNLHFSDRPPAALAGSSSTPAPTSSVSASSVSASTNSTASNSDSSENLDQTDNGRVKDARVQTVQLTPMSFYEVPSAHKQPLPLRYSTDEAIEQRRQANRQKATARIAAKAQRDKQQQRCQALRSRYRKASQSLAGSIDSALRARDRKNQLRKQIDATCK